MLRLPIAIDRNLRVRIGPAVAVLTAHQALVCAERLIRVGTRAMVIESAAEAEIDLAPRRASPRARS